VIALDTNILIYAHRPEAEQHQRAVRAVRGLIEGAARWALPWCVAHEFVAVLTRLGPRPAPPEVALEALERLLGAPNCTPIAEPHGYLRTFADLLRTSGARRELIYDARIAATCLAHGVSELWSADRDFGRFPALKVRNPLVG
jgi:toxin-antitoxin system PIN domain toxin